MTWIQDLKVYLREFADDTKLGGAVDSHKDRGFAERFWQIEGLGNHKLHKIWQEQVLDSAPAIAQLWVYVQMAGWEVGEQPCGKGSVGSGWQQVEHE